MFEISKKILTMLDYMQLALNCSQVAAVNLYLTISVIYEAQCWFLLKMLNECRSLHIPFIIIFGCEIRDAVAFLCPLKISSNL